MIFELCKETGWTIEYVLKMSARRFFALKKTMFDIQREDRFIHLMDLCDVQFISIGQSGYYDELREYYRSSLFPDYVKKRLNSRTFDMENEDDRQKAANILEATFKQQARLMGLG